MEPEQVLDLISPAPGRYDTVRAVMRYRGDGRVRRSISERVLRSEDGRRAFEIPPRETAEAIQHPAHYTTPDGPFGWRTRAWHADRFNLRLETGLPGGGVMIAACNGRRRLSIGGPWTGGGTRTL